MFRSRGIKNSLKARDLVPQRTLELGIVEADLLSDRPNHSHPQPLADQVSAPPLKASQKLDLRDVKT